MFDTSPVSVLEQPKVKVSAPAPVPSAKKEALQKAIANSSKIVPAKNESLDLESFLQGFL